MKVILKRLMSWLFPGMILGIDMNQIINYKKNDNKVITKSLFTFSSDIAKDFAEIGIDEVISLLSEDSDLLEKLPFVKWAVVLNTFRSSIQTASFIKKYIAFIGPIQEACPSEVDRQKLFEGLRKDNKLVEKIAEQTLIALDRYQKEIKATLLGQLFRKTFMEEIFSHPEYNKIMYSIELIHPFDGLKCLEGFYKLNSEYLSALNKEDKNEVWMRMSGLDFSSLSSTGFLRLPTGRVSAGNLGGAWINELGKKFYEEIYKPIKPLYEGEMDFL